jgi:SAM-dependent MidA family methyltransferase
MGSSDTSPSPVASPAFLAAFREHADATAAMTFAQFMHLALYHPVVGYYRRDRARVGYAPGTDFFTASTSGPIFGELVAAACVHLLGDRTPRDYTFVEIGAEPGRSILDAVAHPFAATRTIQVGEPIALHGPCVVFSNELFDAQPCTRHVFRQGRWRELGVRLTTDDRLVEVEFSTSATSPTAPAAPAAPAPEGYHFDQPFAAATLAAQIAAQPWSGLFVAFDYGKSLRELAEETPAGTVRAYSRHTQSNDLLAQPGEQDLTCHVCWDWIGDALSQHGFVSPQLQSQESFFIRHAADFIAATSTAEASRLSQRKLSLLQLLSPAHLGQKFQVLHALRDRP